MPRFTPALRPAPVPLLLALLALGCGDSSSATESDASAGPSVSSDASASVTGGTTGLDETTAGGASGGTTAGLSESDSSDSSETTAACECEPGEVLGCVDLATQSVCDDSCSISEQSCPFDQACIDDACVDVVCFPGDVRCTEEGAELCEADGGGYAPPVACAATEECVEGSGCVDACEQAAREPSSIGCSFLGMSMDNYANFDDAQADSIVVGNFSSETPAVVQLYFAPGGVEQPEGDPVIIPPEQVYTFELTAPEIESGTALRVGGGYRVESDIPVIAYQHAPIDAQQTNDASMLLPEHGLGQLYVIASEDEGDTYAGELSYFDVIAIEDGTTVEWTPTVDTLAGDGVPAIAAGQTGELTLNRFDTLQIAAAAKLDLTGTLVLADRPVWVMGAAACTSVPYTIPGQPGGNTCDHIEEQLIPVEYWGKSYLAARAPTRGDELFYWRIFAGDDDVTITTSPDQTGGPVTLSLGEFAEFTTTEDFVVSADGPIMPVQYLESQNAGAGTGDPSMVQQVPVEQFLRRYAFSTGFGYTVNYVQVIRELAGGAVYVDGVEVTGFSVIGDYELANWPIDEGPHFAESAQPFGIINYGYTTVTSYGYPGGMQLEVLNPIG